MVFKTGCVIYIWEPPSTMLRQNIMPVYVPVKSVGINIAKSWIHMYASASQAAVNDPGQAHSDQKIDCVELHPHRWVGNVILVLRCVVVA